MILAACLFPSRLLTKSDFSSCVSGGLSVLMAGDLNAKHVDSNSRLTTARGKLLYDYANTYSCLNYGLDKPYPSVNDCVLSTKFGSFACIDRY